MPIAKGYLSRVVADAHRPTHSSSIPHAMGSRRGFDLALSPVADKDGQLSTDRVTVAKHGVQAMRSEKKHQKLAPEASQNTGNSETGNVQQSNLLPGLPVGKDEQHASEKSSVDTFISGANRNSDGLTDAIVGQENVQPAVLSKQDAKSSSDKAGTAVQASFEHLSDSSEQRQEAQPLSSHNTGKTVYLGSNSKVGQHHSEIALNSVASPRITQDMQHTRTRETDEFEAQEARKTSLAQHPSSEPLQQPAADTEAKMTDQIPEARKLETPPREHAFGKSSSVNQAEPAVPQVHIGQVDVVVVSEAKAPAKTSSASVSGDFSSRNYLRRL